MKGHVTYIPQQFLLDECTTCKSYEKIDQTHYKKQRNNNKSDLRQQLLCSSR